MPLAVAGYGQHFHFAARVGGEGHGALPGRSLGQCLMRQWPQQQQPGDYEQKIMVFHRTKSELLPARRPCGRLPVLKPQSTLRRGAAG